jgi:hypothetical protein
MRPEKKNFVAVTFVEDKIFTQKLDSKINKYNTKQNNFNKTHYKKNSHN